MTVYLDAFWNNFMAKLQSSGDFVLYVVNDFVHPIFSGVNDDYYFQLWLVSAWNSEVLKMDRSPEGIVDN